MYQDFKKSGVIHKIINQKIRSKLFNGISALEITEFIENEIKFLTKYDENSPLKAGIGFPVGISINDVAAHFTPSNNRNFIIKDDDVVKIDYGVHINGCISDGAFSWCPSGKYDELINIAEEATSIGIKNAGVDAILGNIGYSIQEIIENSEIEIDGKLKSIKSIYDLCGHQIKPYIIHAGKVVPNVALPYMERMKENEVYAIETFPTTGNGSIFYDNECNHYMIDKIYEANIIEKNIFDTRSTLPFCPRWFNFDIPDSKYIKKYPVIKTVDKGIVAQFEKTIFIGDKKVEVIN
jgi:methionyl aminopeptidase